MATLGALNNTTINSSRGSSVAYFSSVTLPEDGTLDSMSAWMFDAGSTDDYRMGIFAGGTSDTDITGATLVWDSGLITAPPPAPGWSTLTAGGESLTAGRLWLVGQSNSSAFFYTVASPNNGGMNLNTYGWAAAKGYLAGGFPSTALALDLNISSTQSLKAYITYTAGGGGGISIPVVYHHRAQMMGS